MRLYTRILLHAVALGMLFAGCSQKVNISTLAPAKVPSIDKARRIAVVPFKNDRVGLSGEITALLANQSIDSKPYFTVLSRQSLNKVIAEQKLQSSQLVDTRTATKIGELIGAQALVTGDIGMQNATSRRYYQNKQECLNFSKDGSRCLLWRFYTVTCHVTKATLLANINIVNVQTGSIIYSDTLSKNYSKDSCHRRYPFYTSEHVLSKAQALNMLSMRIAREFVSDLTPHYVHFQVKLLDDIEIDTTDKQSDALKNALLFIKANRLHKARMILQRLMFELHGKSYVVAYDLGVVNEALGKLKDAQELYRQADHLVNKPVPALDTAIVRISELIRQKKIAQSQLDEQ